MMFDCTEINHALGLCHLCGVQGDRAVVHGCQPHQRLHPREDGLLSHAGKFGPALVQGRHIMGQQLS